MVSRMLTHSLLPVFPHPTPCPLSWDHATGITASDLFLWETASRALHLVLEMKAKDVETLSPGGWFRRRLLPDGRSCP